MSQIASRRLILGEDGVRSEFLANEDTTNELMKQLLESAHYDYSPINKYQLLDDSYRASGGFSNGDYLIPHPRERQDKYNRRKNLAYYINYVKPIVDAHINPIFNNEPARDGVPPTYSLFLNDVDGNGTRMSRFMKKAAIRAKLHGCEFICVDMENIDSQAVLTTQDVINNRIYPYLYLISPEQVLRWATDKFGRLIYFKYFINSKNVNDEGNIENVKEIYTWTSTSFQKQIGDGEPTVSENSLGVIPIIPLYGTLNNSDELIPNSDMYAISQAEMALYNVCSELRERNRNQAFSILSYPVGEDDDYESMFNSINIGTTDMLLYRTGSQEPKYITPPTSSSDMLVNEINLIKREIFRMASMSFVTQEQVSNVSGLAKAYDNQQLYQTIKELSDGCQEAEYKIARLFGVYMMEDMSKLSIVYNNEFGIVDPTEVLTNATQALALNICGDFNGEIKKQVVRAILTDVDSTVVERVIKNLENDPTKQDPINDGQDVKVIQPTTK